jgi:septum formation protein
VLREIMSYEILLASRSPRREALMKELGIPFRVVGAEHGREEYPPGLSGGEIARFLADRKSDSYVVPLGRKQILLTADTIVWHRDKELGKPAGPAEALSMIRQLSGSTHQVFTGVCLRSAAQRRSFYTVTDVTFSRLEEDEAEAYVTGYRPFDKAGGYGIQEWIGYIAVERINGSYFNVMGLPVQKVYIELKALISTEPAAS